VTQEVEPTHAQSLPEVKPASTKRANIMPNEFTFRHIDEHARKVRQ